MIKKIKVISSVLLMYLAILACNLPSEMRTQSASNELNLLTLTPTFTSVDFDSATVTVATLLTQECAPGLIANQDANVRSGSSQLYNTC